MLSKEEIENSFIRIETICKKEVCLFNQPIIEGNLNQIKRYIIQLESDKQKLIEKIEGRIKEYKEKSGGNTYHIQSIINAEIRELDWVLSILKGEKYANKSKWR